MSDYRVGLTGGIASGKSTVSELFAQHGVDVIDADVLAREIVAPGQPALATVGEEFGPGVLTEDGSLDRQALRRLVFQDAEKRARLEQILHPPIRRLMMERARAARGPYCILAVPLLIEGELFREVDRVLVVDVDAATQRERLKWRDGGTDKEIEAILNAQTGRAERLTHADDVIDNSGSLEDLAAQVDRLHHYYLELARFGSSRTAERRNPGHFPREKGSRKP